MRKKPMLAYPVSDKPIEYNKISIQPKLDGVRCVIQCDAGVVTAYSRTGKETWISIFEVKPFVDQIGECIFVGLPTQLITKYGSQLKESYYKLDTNNDR